MDGQGKIALGIVAAALVLVCGNIGYREWLRRLPLPSKPTIADVVGPAMPYCGDSTPVGGPCYYIPEAMQSLAEGRAKCIDGRLFAVSMDQGHVHLDPWYAPVSCSARVDQPK